jgi:hypothetical protein
MKRYVLLLIVTALVAVIGLWRLIGDTSAETTTTKPVPLQAVAPENDESSGDALTMVGVLQKAGSALDAMQSQLDDYTARFVKQERDTAGTLGPVNEIALKVQTRFGGDQNDSPRRVYLRFSSPDALAGREVIWGQDLYDGKMAVHEVGMLFQLKTIWLNPNGMIAMQGQRFPISEVGLVKLVEKLIERGQQDIDNLDVSITQVDDHLFDGRPAELIRVKRKTPSGEAEDFSLAEIVVDDERQLIVAYRSFGWPATPDEDAPLLESYGYYDLKTNVGLTDTDFDVKNLAYGFPRF